MSTEAKCPFHQTAGGGTGNRDWWRLSRSGSTCCISTRGKSDPMGAGFDYA